MKQLRDKWAYGLIAVSLIIFIYSVVQILLYATDFGKETVLEVQLQKIHEKTLPEKMQEISIVPENKQSELDKDVSARIKNELLAMNPDYVGWLEISDTEITNPVVFRDNDYYLSHDFSGKANRHGTLFLDAKCNEEDAVWLIHGHHMKDGTMFAGLKNFKKIAYLQEHKVLTFDFGEGDIAYQLYAAALIDFSVESEGGYAFHYEKLPKSDTDFADWQKQLKVYSYWYDDEAASLCDRTATQDVMVLSTCEYGTDFQRLILTFVKIK